MLLMTPGAKAKLSTSTYCKAHDTTTGKQNSKSSMDVIDEKQTDNYAGLEGKVKTKVFGQNEAIEKLVDPNYDCKSRIKILFNKPNWSLLVCRSNWCW